MGPWNQDTLKYTNEHHSGFKKNVAGKSPNRPFTSSIQGHFPAVMGIQGCSPPQGQFCQ